MDTYHLFWHLVRFVVLWVAAMAPSLAGTIDPNTPDSKYVEFGKQFPNVVQLSAKVKCLNPQCEFKSHAQKGSAVVIAPHWLLTAAHVVQDGTHHTAILADQTTYDLPHVVWHKDFDNSTFGVNDIALCYSPKEIVMEFYPELYDQDDELGKAITLAGWGFSGTFNTGASVTDGKRRAGQNVIAGSHRTVLTCVPRRQGRFPLEFMIAPGDSGGGMFIGNKLAGINSFLMAGDSKPDGTYGDESAFTRVSLYVQWVKDQIAAYEQQAAP